MLRADGVRCAERQLGATEADAGAGGEPVVAEAEVVAAADVHPVAAGAAGARRSSFKAEVMFQFNRQMANRMVRFGVRTAVGEKACRCARCSFAEG